LKGTNTLTYFAATTTKKSFLTSTPDRKTSSGDRQTRPRRKSGRQELRQVHAAADDHGATGGAGEAAEEAPEREHVEKLGEGSGRAQWKGREGVRATRKFEIDALSDGQSVTH
jgi:hypothetical protein